MSNPVPTSTPSSILTMIRPEQIVEFVGKSGQAMSALYKDVMSDPKKKQVVVDILQKVATVYIANQTLPFHNPSQPVVVAHEKVVLNDHAYSGSTLRKILTSFLMTIAVAAGVTGVYVTRDHLRTHMNRLVQHMNLASVLNLLGGIVTAVVLGLKTIHTTASESFKKLLKNTKAKGNRRSNVSSDEIL